MSLSNFHTIHVFTTCMIVAGRREVLVASQTFPALSSLLVGGGPKCWLLNIPSKKRGCTKNFSKEETLEYLWIVWRRELTVGNRCSVRGVATFLPLPPPSSTKGTYFMCIMQKMATSSREGTSFTCIMQKLATTLAPPPSSREGMYVYYAKSGNNIGTSYIFNRRQLFHMYFAKTGNNIGASHIFNRAMTESQVSSQVHKKSHSL